MDRSNHFRDRMARLVELVRGRPGPSTAIWVIALVGLAMARQGGIVFDDPFILFRYAENLATGHGWSFNATVPSDNAVTSPLYVLILAALRGAGFEIPATATLLFATSIATCAIATAATLRAIGRPVAAVGAATLIATSPVLVTLWGMESALLLALLSTLLYLVVTHRPLWLVGLVWAALTLTRPEGLLLGAVIVVALVVLDRSRRRSASDYATLGLTTVVPLILWVAAALVLVGEPLPSTLGAKIAQAESGRWSVFSSFDGLRSLGYAAGLSAANLYSLATIVLAAIAVIGAVVRRRDRRFVTVLSAFILTITVGYGLVIGVADYPWYYAVPLYGVLTLAAMGIDETWSLARSTGWARVAVCLLVPIVAVVGIGRIRSTITDVRGDYDYVGTWLRYNTAPGSTVASMEIGTIGWYSGRTMIDYLGLLDASVIDRVAEGDFVHWLVDLQPDYWVTTGAFIDEAATADDCIMRHFDVNMSTPNLVVLHRNGPIRPDDCPMLSSTVR